MTGFLQSAGSHSLKNQVGLDAYPFVKCLMFACFSLSFVSNFAARSALQKNHIGGPCLTVLAIKMRGPDVMRAGDSLWRVMQRDSTGRDRYSSLREIFFFFLQIVPFVLCPSLIYEHLIATSDGIKWVKCTLT